MPPDPLTSCHECGWRQKYPSIHLPLCSTCNARPDVRARHTKHCKGCNRPILHRPGNVCSLCAFRHAVPLPDLDPHLQHDAFPVGSEERLGVLHARAERHLPLFGW